MRTTAVYEDKFAKVHAVAGSNHNVFIKYMTETQTEITKSGDVFQQYLFSVYRYVFNFYGIEFYV